MKNVTDATVGSGDDSDGAATQAAARAQKVEQDIELCKKFMENLYAELQKCIAEGGDGCDSGFDDTGLNSFCPETGNKLRSINSKTMVGDPCSSTNIAQGDVFKYPKPNKDGIRICSCYARLCHDSYNGKQLELRGGACREKVEPNYCARKESQKEWTLDECKENCKNYGAREKCAIKSYTLKDTNKSQASLFGPGAYVDWSNNKIVFDNKGKCICNPESSEYKSMVELYACPTSRVSAQTDKSLDFKKQLNAVINSKGITTLDECKKACLESAKAMHCKTDLSKAMIVKSSSNLCMCDVRDSDRANYIAQDEASKYKQSCRKGKGHGVCVTDFSKLDVDLLGATGLATEYMRKNDKDANGKCKEFDAETDRVLTTYYVQCFDSKQSYEFKFDDITESSTGDAGQGLVQGLCELYGLKFYDAAVCIGECPEALKEAAKRFGLNARRNGNNVNTCYLARRMPMDENGLAQIDGINSFKFQDVKIMASDRTIEQIKQYVQSCGYSVDNFRCEDMPSSYVPSNIKSKGAVVSSMFGKPVLRCYLNNEPVDFVFSDTNVGSVQKRQGGESKIECLSLDGKYVGSKCTNLSEAKCTELGNRIKKLGGTGTTYSDGECKMRDVSQEKVIRILEQTGMAALSLLDCVFDPSKVVCVVGTIEVTSFAAEMAVEGYALNRVKKFVTESSKCNASACAINTIRKFAKEMAQLQKVTSEETTTIDTELSRLVGLINDEDAKTLGLSGDQWSDVVTQLSKDQSDNGASVINVLHNVFIVGQFASFSVIGLHLTGKALVKLGNRMASNATDAAKVAKAEKVAKTGGKLADFGKSTKVKLAELENKMNSLATQPQVKRYIAAQNRMEELSKTPLGKNSTEYKKLQQEVNTLKNNRSVQSYISIEKEYRGLGGTKTFDVGSDAGKADDGAKTGGGSGAKKADNGAKTGDGSANGNSGANKADNGANTGGGSANGNSGAKGAETTESRMVSKYKAEVATSSSLAGKPQYYRVVVNGMKSSDINKMVKDLRENGYYVSSNMTTSGDRFIGFSKENVFSNWEKSQYNWLKQGTTTRIATDAELRAVWKEYAPKNETFEHFKKGTAGTFDDGKFRTWTKAELDDWVRSQDAKISEAEQLVANKAQHKSERELLNDIATPGIPEWQIRNYIRYAGDINSMPKESQAAMKDVIDKMRQNNPDKYSELHKWISDEHLLQNPNTAGYSTWNQELSKLNKDSKEINKKRNEVYHYLKGHGTDEETAAAYYYDSLTDAQKKIIKDKAGVDKNLMDLLNEKGAGIGDKLEFDLNAIKKIDEIAGMHKGSTEDVIKMMEQMGYVRGYSLGYGNTAIERLMAERRQMFSDIVKKPEIYNRAQRWRSLSLDEKEQLCKDILHEANKKVGIEDFNFKIQKVENAGGYWSASKKEIVMGMDDASNGFAQMMETLSHEHGHAVDDISPNQGAVGAQAQNVGSQVYRSYQSGATPAQYRLNGTEQSSFEIGTAVKSDMEALGLF